MQNTTSNHPIRSKRIHSLILIFILHSITLILPSCSDPGNSGDGNDQPVRVQLSVLSGNEQTGPADQALPSPLVIQVTDFDSNPVPGVRLSCTVLDGGGQPSNPSPTDSSGQCQVHWILGANHNMIRIRVADPDFSGTEIYAYASAENATGVARMRSFYSLKREEAHLYSMTIYGDYQAILDSINLVRGGTNNPEQPSVSGYFCSLFTSMADPANTLMGRSFDNPQEWPDCLTIALRTCPPGGYESLTLVRLRDVGYHDLSTDLRVFSTQQKMRLFESVYYCPDGINENGVVAGLANVDTQTFDVDPAKPSIFITYLVRRIMDHAKDLDEAVGICLANNIYGSMSPNGNLDVHVLISDPSGRSAIVEMADGELKVIPNTQNFQLMTNSPVYDRTIPQQRAQCPRFRYLYDRLEGLAGLANESQAFALLSGVDFPPATEWSAVYLMNERVMAVVIESQFDQVHYFGFGLEHKKRINAR